MKRTFLNKKILGLLVVFFAAVVLGLLKGSVDISFKDLFLEQNRTILFLRLLRVVLCIMAGSGLAVSGIVLQAILRNPLAEPYLLGTSSGAGLGAAVAVIWGFSAICFPIAAFTGAILSVLLVYAIARQGRKVPAQSLILSGVIVSIALSGIIVFLISVSGSKALHGLTWWLWGSLEVYDVTLLEIVSVIVLAGIIAVYCFSQDLNAMSIGEEEAVHLGVNIEVLKKILFLIISLITASLVSVCGVIGFVGLIIPHLMRFFVGPNHKILIPCSCIGAAAFMVLCDTLSRTLFAPLEIPIGVITAVLGAPMFIVLLKREQEVK